MYRDDDERSYQDKLDGLFYKGKAPIKNEPFTLFDICKATVELVKRILRPEYFTGFVFFFTRSVTITCKFCGIKRRTFYYHIIYLKSVCPRHHRKDT